MCLGMRARSVRRSDNLTAICVPIVYMRSLTWNVIDSFYFSYLRLKYCLELRVYFYIPFELWGRLILRLLIFACFSTWPHKERKQGLSCKCIPIKRFTALLHLSTIQTFMKGSRGLVCQTSNTFICQRKFIKRNYQSWTHCSLKEWGNLRMSHDVTNTLRLKLYSLAWVRKRTIPTERLPIVCEVSAKFCCVTDPQAVFSVF
jgi:hypothetical protein